MFFHNNNSSQQSVFILLFYFTNNKFLFLFIHCPVGTPPAQCTSMVQSQSQSQACPFSFVSVWYLSYYIVEIVSGWQSHLCESATGTGNCDVPCCAISSTHFSVLGCIMNDNRNESEAIFNFTSFSSSLSSRHHEQLDFHWPILASLLNNYGRLIYYHMIHIFLLHVSQLWDAAVCTHSSTTKCLHPCLVRQRLSCD